MAETPFNVAWVGGVATAYFVPSPNPSELEKFFREFLVAPTYLYFSDDASMSFPYLREDGVVAYSFANVDISSCDSSQGPEVFKALEFLTPDDLRTDMSKLISQCRQPCVAGYGKDKLTFVPKNPFEYSGSLLTTTLNNVSTSCIFKQLLGEFPLLPLSAAKEELKRRAQVCGWQLTMEFCDFAGVQFLKCSPTYDVDGVVRAFFNWGPILRMLGQKTGDLPGSGPLSERAETFNGQLVAGLRHAGNSRLIRVLRQRFPLKGGQKVAYNTNSVFLLDTSGSSCDRELDDVECCKRYRLTLSEYDRLCESIANSRIGEVINLSRLLDDPAHSPIYVDYGL